MARIPRGELKQANPCACVGAALEVSRALQESFTDTSIQCWLVDFSRALGSLYRVNQTEVDSLEDEQSAGNIREAGRMNMSEIGVSFLCWTREASQELLKILPIH